MGVDVRRRTFSDQTRESLIEKLQQRALYYKNLAQKAVHVPGMEDVAAHYAEHAGRYETAVAQIRSGRSAEAAGAATEPPASNVNVVANREAAARAAARRKRMLEQAQ